MSAAMRHLKKRWNDRRPESFSSGEGDSCCEQSSSNRSVEVNRSSAKEARLPVGTRVKKYFHGHGWCLGQVVAFVKGRYQVQYEHLATKKDCFYEAHEMPRLIKTASVVPGTKLEIYWPHEQRYYKALIKSENCRKRENYWICYEARKSCADREWIDLHRHKFRILETPPEVAASASHHHHHNRLNSKEDVVVVVQPDASDENDESLDSWGKTTSCEEFPTREEKHSGNVIAKLPKAITSSMPEDNISPQSSVQFEVEETEQHDLLASPVVQTDITGDNEMNGANIDKVSPSSSNSRCSAVAAKICDLDVISPVWEKRNNTDEAIDAPLPIVSSKSSPRRKLIVEEPEEFPCDPRDSALDEKMVDADVATSVPFNGDAPRASKEEKEEGIIIDPDSDLATQSAVCSLIEVGSRVAVYWEEDDEFFPGTITDRSFRGKPFYLEYDDGETEWIDLRKHRFRLLPPVVKDEAVTSRNRRSSNSSDDVVLNRTRKQQQKSTAAASKRCPSPSITSPDSRQTRSSAKSDDTPLSLCDLSSYSVRSAAVEASFAKSKRAVSAQNSIDDDSDSSVSVETEWSLNSPPPKRPVDRRDRVEADIAQITVGSRVAVWWEGDKQYYNGVVQRQRHHKKPFYLVYDDGEAEEWIDFRQQKFKLLSNSVAGEKQGRKSTKKADAKEKSVTIDNLGGKRRRSDCDVEEQIDNRKKARARRGDKDEPVKQKNDGAELKQNHLDSTGADSIKSSPDVCSLITVGSRVAVYWEGESKYYEGVVTRERSSSKRKHYLEYDDGEAAHWIDFREHWVRILPDSKTSRSKRSGETTSKNQKTDEAAVPETPPVITRSKKQNSIAEVNSGAQSTPITRNRSNAIADSPAEISSKSATKRSSISTKLLSPDRSISSRGSAIDVVNVRVDKNKSMRKIEKEISSHKRAGEEKGANRKSGNGKATLTIAEKEKSGRGKSEKESFGFKELTSENAEDLFERSIIIVGSRVEIWWNGDEKYYSGTVSRITPKKFFVLYDDGEVEWVSKTKQKYRLLEPKSKTIQKKTTKVVNRKAESESEDSEDEQSSASEEDHMAYDDFVFGKVDHLRVGSRISVWWTGDKKYYNGTLKKINNRTGVRRPYFVRYDDHDEEWTDLRRRYFRVLD